MTSADVHASLAEMELAASARREEIAALEAQLASSVMQKWKTGKKPVFAPPSMAPEAPRDAEIAEQLESLRIAAVMTLSTICEAQETALSQPARAVDALRRCHFDLDGMFAKSTKVLSLLEDAHPPTSRVGYLVPIEDVLPRIKRPWRDEWVDLLEEHFKATGRPERDASWVKANADLESVQERPVFVQKVPKLVAAGWPVDREDGQGDAGVSALDVVLLTSYCGGIGRMVCRPLRPAARRPAAPPTPRPPRPPRVHASDHYGARVRPGAP